jgi:hypothetical protein
MSSPDTPKHTLSSLLAGMEGYDAKAAHLSVLRKLIEEAGGDPSAISILFRHAASWAGFSGEGELELVADGRGKRFLILTDWGETQVMDVNQIAAVRAHLSREVSILDLLSGIVDGGGEGQQEIERMLLRLKDLSPHSENQSDQ